LLKGFKEFLMRGNIIDLAIAVVVGTAFTAVVTTVTSNLIKPMINVIGGANVGGFGVRLDGDKQSTYIDLASIINGVLNFLIIAAVVYFAMVLPMQKIKERRARNKEPEPVEPTDVELLTEIRDLLKEQRERESQSS
jgi:large conductance mechanosensitive channel